MKKLNINKVIREIRLSSVNGFKGISHKDMLDYNKDDYKIVFQSTIDDDTFLKVEVSNNENKKAYQECTLKMNISIQFKNMTITYRKHQYTKKMYIIGFIRHVKEIEEFREYFKQFQNDINLFELS